MNRYTNSISFYPCKQMLYDDKVYVSAIKMSNEALVGTILHESLHNIGTINGKDICEKDEHTIMKSLGEQLDY